MKVVMQVAMSGTRNGEDWPAKGAVIEIPDAEAVDYINARICAPAEDAPEVATASEPEAATTTRARKR